MTNTNATNLRKNLFSYLDSTIEYNDIINVNTKKGNVIIISESEYNGLLETLYLLSDPTMKEKLEAAKNATDDDYAQNKKWYLLMTTAAENSFLPEKEILEDQHLLAIEGQSINIVIGI